MATLPNCPDVDVITQTIQLTTTQMLEQSWSQLKSGSNIFSIMKQTHMLEQARPGFLTVNFKWQDFRSTQQTQMLDTIGIWLIAEWFVN